jgi:sugar lactone lactonase YvrE
MKRLNICGNRFGWLPAFLFVFALLCSGSLPEVLAQTLRGLPEYIYQQPVSTFEREGGAAGFALIFAFGTKDADIEVDWYKDGAAYAELKPVLKTYQAGTATEPQLWNPYQNYLIDNAAKYAARPGSDADYMAVWESELRVDNVTSASAGVYSARTRVGKLGSPRISSNEAYLSVVPKDPAEALKIVSAPPSRSLAAPGSNPRPSLKLYADMKSQVSALFNTPFATATDADGFTYVADTLNHCIRRLSPGGRTTTVAGIDGQPLDADVLDTNLTPPLRLAWAGYERRPSPGYKDGTSNQGPTGYRAVRTTAAEFVNEPRFRAPEALTVSDTGVIYVADTGNHTIRGIRVSGGSANVFHVYGDAPAPNPTPGKLNSPRGIVFAGSSSDPVDNPPVLYVMDSSNYSVKKLYLTASGTLDTTRGAASPTPPYAPTGCENIAGLGLTPGWQGTAVSATDAKFYSPRGIVFMKDPKTGADTLYIADTVNHVLRQLVRENNQWTARTVVGFVGAKGDVNGVGTAARLNFPVGLAVDPDHRLLYFTEFGTHSLRRVNLPYSPRTVEPGATRKTWEVDDVAGSGYYGPAVFGPNGPQGTGKGDGLGPDAVFYYPAGISFNNDGSLMVADSNNHAIRKVRVSRAGEWLGESSLVAGIVGHSGNRDFSERPGFTFQWKKDALMMADGPAVSGGMITGSDKDTLYVENIGYEDAGVYALVVTNSFSDEIELPQSFVYVATAGDRPKFLAPGYRIVEQSKPNEPLADLQQDMDIYVSADILPADQVTYQWEVAQEVLGGVYQWIPLSDELLSLQPSLHTLLGDRDTTIIRGSTTARLAISKFQGSLSGILPGLRFRVRVAMRSEPTLELDTRLEKTGMTANWTVAPQQTVAVATSSGTLYSGMTLSGGGFKQGTKIAAVNGGTLTLDTPALSDQIIPGPFTAVLGGTSRTVTGSWTAVPEQILTVDSVENLSTGMYLLAPGSLFAADTKIDSIDTSTPGAFVLVLNKPALLPGIDRQIYAGEDLSKGTGLAIRFPADFSDKNLSVLVNGAALTGNPLKSSDRVELFLTAGGTAVIGNPTPTLQWYRRNTLTDPPTLVGTGTSHSFLVGPSDHGFYSVTATNYGRSVESNSVFLDVERPATLKIVSMTLDGGSLTQNVLALQERVVDKTKSSALSLIANVDASAQPEYEWTFTPDDPASPVSDLSKTGASIETKARTFGQLSFDNLSDDADGVFKVKITVGSGTGAVTSSGSWHVTVKYPPQFIGNKVFKVNGVNTTDDSATVDLNENNELFLSADFKSPPTLPLTYRWRRDKVILDSTTNSLKVVPISKMHLGTYRLEVTNALGTLVFGPTTGAEVPFPGAPAGWELKASGKPSVVIQPTGKPLFSRNSNISAAFAGTVAAAPRNLVAAAFGSNFQRVALGQRLALQVAVDADPAPDYQWYKAVSDGPFLPIPNAKSAIYVLPTATGTPGVRSKYYVVAKNSLGEVQSDEIVVQTEGLPDPVISATVIATPAWAGAPAPFPNGSVVILSAAVTDSLAPYTYQWKVGGNVIFGAVSKELTLSNIEPGQAGLYSVVATGVAGSKESAKFTVAVTAATVVAKHFLVLDGAEELKTLLVSPTPTEAGFAAGTRVTLSGMAPPTKMLQSWRVSYTNADGQTLTALLPARSAQFVMPAADVTVTPILSRPYTGNYTGLLSLEAPWLTAEGSEWSTEAELFRPTGLEPGLGNIRGFFSCTVSTLGAVSGQIQLENKIYSFTTVLDAEMRGSFRIATTLKGIAWSMNGTLAFNPTEENRQQDYVDNVLHVVLKDTLLAAPPVVQVGQTLYGTAAGFSGAADALRADIIEAVTCCGMDTQAPTAANPLAFTAAVYRESNGETKPNSYGQAAVLSVLVRQATGIAIVQGYLGNGTKVTFSTYLGRAFITPEMEGPDVLEIDPRTAAAVPFLPKASLLSGQAAEALSETLLRRSSSQSLALWFRGDLPKEPLFGTMIFNGPRVYGSLGALNENGSTKLSEYTPNALAGYFYDSTEPHLANLPANQFIANQTTVMMTTPDTYPSPPGLTVSWPTATFTPPSNVVLATVDRTTGLLFGGVLESTSRYVQTSPPYSPLFAASKPLLACTTAAVIIQRRDILPDFTWTTNPLGGYVGFLYRGKNAPLEPCKNVLGNGTPETALLGGKATERIEPFLINIVDQY